MRTFFASLYKDLKLFLSGAGLLALILPLLLLPALRAGTQELPQGTVASFPIAVRDLDGTVMSRSLIEQLREIQLFSQVLVLDGGETDGEALESGAAAVATIPKDFFYDLYTMDDCPVEVTLNSARPLDSAIFRSVFTSVMGIIRANYVSALSAYTLVYGELDGTVMDRVREASGNRLLLDALGRGQVFDGPAELADLTGGLTRRVTACVISLMAVLLAITALKTVPEERTLGVIPRLRALGCGGLSRLASRYIVSYAAALPLIILASRLTGGFPTVAALFAILLLVSMAALSPLTRLRSAAGVQRWGGIFLLVSTALSGTVLPAPTGLSRLTIPGCARLALDCAGMGVPFSDIIRLLLPLPATAIIGIALYYIVPHLSVHPRRIDSPSSPSKAIPAKTGILTRALGMSAVRLKLVSGGTAALLVTVAAAALCGAASAGLTAPDSLRVGVVDLDGSDFSHDLVDALEASPGIQVVRISSNDHFSAMLREGLEGVLTIPEGASELVDDGKIPGLNYTQSGGSMAAHVIRETVGGITMAQLRRAWPHLAAQDLLGRPLTPAEEQELADLIKKFEKSLPTPYNIEYFGGKPAPEPWSPSPMAFACFAAVFTLLTSAAALRTRDGRAVRRRLRSLRKGSLIGLFSEILPLFLLGFVVIIVSLVPAGLTLPGILAALSAAWCFSTLSLLFASITQREGRLDSLAPLLALSVCALGGCFIDFAQLSPALEALTLISPAGLAVRAASGSLPALAALLAEGTFGAALCLI